MKKSSAIILFIVLVFSSTHSFAKINFVDITSVAPEIETDIRYATNHNFVGQKIDGYLAPKCLLTNEAANALSKVQSELAKKSLSLKVYDCYRPARAVKHFVRWAQDIADTKMKAEFYPSVNKTDLFSLGYIAAKSSHSRGSTVDVTIVNIGHKPQEAFDKSAPLKDCRAQKSKRFADSSVDMGSGFDCFDEISHTENSHVEGKAKLNRLMLKDVMERHGFKAYDKEWWHFTLLNEPHPDKYFDFVIQ